MRRKYLWLLAAVFGVLALSACGGSGGGDSPPAPAAAQWDASNWGQANWQ